MERLAKTLLLLLLLPSLAWGATQIYSENFDDQTLNSPWIIRRYGGAASSGEYGWVTGRGGSGYALGNGTYNAVWAEWIGSYGGTAPGTWPSDEIYMSFWVRYPNGVANMGSNYFKLAYWYFNYNSGMEQYDKMEMSLTSSTGLTCVFYDSLISNGGADQFDYPSFTSIDTNWHHVEIWLKFSTSVWKLWYDRPEGDYTSEATTTTDGTYLRGYRQMTGNIWNEAKDVACLNAGSMQNGSSIGTIVRYIDDIEVWDGIPDSTPAPAPPTLSNVTISNGSFR